MLAMLAVLAVLQTSAPTVAHSLIARVNRGSGLLLPTALSRTGGRPPQPPCHSRDFRPMYRP